MNLLETKEGRAVVAAVLSAYAKEGGQHDPLVSYLEAVARPGVPTDAFRAVRDPAKLAELLTFEACRCGLSAGLRLREHKDGEPLVYPWEFLHFPNPSVPNAKPGIGICPNRWDVDAPQRDLNMLEARAALAAFLQLSDGDAAGAEKILRGNQ